MHSKLCWRAVKRIGLKLSKVGKGKWNIVLSVTARRPIVGFFLKWDKDVVGQDDNVSAVYTASYRCQLNSAILINIGLIKPNKYIQIIIFPRQEVDRQLNETTRIVSGTIYVQSHSSGFQSSSLPQCSSSHQTYWSYHILPSLSVTFRPNHSFLFTRTSSIIRRLPWNPVGQYCSQTKCL